MISLEEAVAHFLSKPGAEETTPFGPETLVYKVGGKMFGLTSPGDFPVRINLKCDPERAADLRDAHEAITAGWHMNKRHWNTLVLDDSLPAVLVRELIDHSYVLVGVATGKGKNRTLRVRASSTARQTVVFLAAGSPCHPPKNY